MLGAVMFGHKHFQPVIEAIIRLAEKAAKEPRDFQPADMSDGREGGARHRRGRPARSLQDHRQAGALRRRRRRQGEGDGQRSARPRAKQKFSPEKVKAVFKDAQAKVVRWNILDTGTRIDGRDVKTVRPIVAEVGVLPRTHGSALFTRGETQALVVATLGTGEDEQFIDSARRHPQGNLPAALQLPALFGRRDRPHGLAGPPRDRPRQARLARDPSDAAAGARVPLHHPRRLGDHRVERLLLDGDGLRRLAVADGRGRAAAPSGRRHRHGPHPRGRALRGALRHPRRRGSSRRHGLQGRRHGRGHHLAADGHQDRRHHRGDHARRARPGEGRPRPHPRGDEQGADRAARRTRRARAAHRDHADPDRQDPRSDRLGRQGDPRDRREDRRQDQHQG